MSDNQAAAAPEHNYEYGREHDGYSHMGIPPACPACAAEPAPDPTPSAALAGIREREQAATKGPWEADVIPELGGRPVVLLPDPGDEDRADLLFQADAPQATEADAEFIAHSREDIPALVAALEAVLKLADDWDAEARGIFLEAARTADAGEVGAASALQSSAADLREAISREITGGGLAMTAIRTTYLWCDFLRCDKRYDGVDVWWPASAVRREAAKAGWTAKPVSHGRRFTKDYCPDHPGGREITGAHPSAQQRGGGDSA